MPCAIIQDGGHLDCDHEHHLKPNVDVHRFILVLAGALRLPVTPTTGAGALPTTLPANHYLYVPPGFSGTIVADGDTELVVYERRHTKRVLTNAAKPVGGGALMFGNVEDSPELDTGAIPRHAQEYYVCAAADDAQQAAGDAIFTLQKVVRYL